VQAGEERERLLALNQEAEVARAGYERELELAARIQADLFPAALPRLDGYDVAARNRPAKRCGGDYYDALAPLMRAMLFCVADVSGKGLPASLLMSHMQATCGRCWGERRHSPTSRCRPATAAWVTAATSTSPPRCSSWRWPPGWPLRERRHINSWLVRHDGETCAGLDGRPARPAAAGACLRGDPGGVGAGRRRVLCSDGVTDAQNEAGEEFGEDGSRPS